MTAPEPSGEGAVRAMRQALAEGGFTPDDLGHLNAHGTSTHANDAMESVALKALVGEERAADARDFSEGLHWPYAWRGRRLLRQPSARFQWQTIACRPLRARARSTPSAA